MKAVAFALLPLLGAGPTFAGASPAVLPAPQSVTRPGSEVAEKVSSPTELDATWHEWSRHKAPPGAMHYASMAYDTAADLTVMFGGEDTYTGGGLKGTTWTWDKSRWTHLHPDSHPSPRKQQAMAYDPVRDEIVLFGGYDGQIVGDTWTFHDGAWSRLEPPTSPSPRYSHMMAFDPVLQQVVLFGGITGPGVVTDETWTWDGTTWTELHPSVSPSARAGAQLEYDPTRDRLVTFGGQTKDEREDDTWVWDGATWAPVSTRKTPNRRSYYGMSTFGRHVVMYGGNVRLFDVAQWVLKGNGWQKFQPDGPSSPGDRTGLTMEWDSAHHSAVLFGGSEFPSNTWTLKR